MAAPDSPFPNADLLYRLRSLPLAATALQVGAHPDDEESGMIAYLSRGMGVRAVYWSATRGEGGQNRTGPHLGEALGIVRTWESVDARRVDGGEVLYGPFYDFGFSKSGVAALAKWGEEDMTRELVRAIRLVQPQVVISRWSGESGGHGHHQAVGLVVPEAFEAAADPGRFPDLRAEGIAPWCPQKLYFSLGGDWQPGEHGEFGQIDPEFEREGFLRIDTGGVDPIAGRTFQEEAALAINLHRTQGMAFVPDRGDYVLYYRLDRSLVPVPEREHDFFDGIKRDLSWLSSYAARRPASFESLLEQAEQAARGAVQAFRPEEPQPAAELLLAGLDALGRARASLEVEADEAQAALDVFLARKIREFEGAAASCLGLVAECLVPKHRVARGGKTPVTVRLWTKPARGFGKVDLALEAPSGWYSRRVDVRGDNGAQCFEADFEVDVAAGADFSTPYWLQTEREPYRYRWPDGVAHGLPFDRPALSGRIEVEIGEWKLRLTAPAVSREAFVGGFRELDLAVVPPIALTPRESRVFPPQTASPQRLQLHVLARCLQEGGATGELTVQAPSGWNVSPQSARLGFSGADEVQSLEFELEVPGGEGVGVSEVRYEISGPDRYGVSVESVLRGALGVPKPPDETTCIAEALLTRPSHSLVHVLDTEFVAGLRYGYVSGVEEEIVRSLGRFGLDISELDADDLAHSNLATFDEIVVGPNAYLVRDDVRQNASRLLEYVEHGGTLIVQYQGYGYQAGGFAPFPFAYAQPHDRVTFPDASVEILEPEHPLFRLPNEITGADFEGWVHDRGLYFFGEWDEHYVPILESHDPGEDEKRGGLLIAGYGRGMYVYTGYSFFRQIPAGVQGAIQLFANLLGLAEGRIRERMERARNIDLFSFMNEQQLHDVVRLMSERWFDDGSMLAHEGEPARELFLIVEGEVEVVKDAKSDRPRWVASAGEAVGELGVLAEVPRTASLRARGHVKTLTMDGDHLWRLLQANRDLAEGVIRFLATKMAAQR